MAPDLVSGKVQVTNGHDTVDSYNSSAALKSSDFKSINSSFLEESTTYNSSSVHNTLHSLKRDAYKSRYGSVLILFHRWRYYRSIFFDDVWSCPTGKLTH